jgi:hypothetical protein
MAYFFNLAGLAWYKKFILSKTSRYNVHFAAHSASIRQYIC